MKRKYLLILSAFLVMTMVFALAGCKGNEAPAATDVNTAADAAVPAAETEAASAIAAGDVVFTYNGTAVELNGDAQAILAALGEPNDVSSQLSCHGEGDDKTYSYDGFIVNTYPASDGTERVLEVVVNGEGIPTSKGIRLGDTADKVKQTYGDGFRSVGMYLAYDAGDGKSLQFFIENDIVKEIDYYYNV